VVVAASVPSKYVLETLVLEALKRRQCYRRQEKGVWLT